VCLVVLDTNNTNTVKATLSNRIYVDRILKIRLKLFSVAGRYCASERHKAN